MEIDFDDMDSATPSVVLTKSTHHRRHIERVVVPQETAKMLKNAVDTIKTHVKDFE